MVRLTEMIADREGFGDLLAEGAYRMSEHYGHTEYFMGVKKQEFPSYDGRALQGMALGYATQPRGACHIRGELQDLDLYGQVGWRVTARPGHGGGRPLELGGQARSGGRRAGLVLHDRLLRRVQLRLVHGLPRGPDA